MGNLDIVVLTGLLGSGKSTFLKIIAGSDTSYRVGIIRNEFGDELGIFEQPVLLNEEDEAYFIEYIELANGCICCTAATQLTASIEQLLKKKRSAAAGCDLDILLIEIAGGASVVEVLSELVTWTGTVYERTLDQLFHEINLQIKVVSFFDSRLVCSKLGLPAAGCDKMSIQWDEIDDLLEQHRALADLVIICKMDLVDYDSSLLDAMRNYFEPDVYFFSKFNEKAYLEFLDVISHCSIMPAQKLVPPCRLDSFNTESKLIKRVIRLKKSTVLAMDELEDNLYDFIEEYAHANGEVYPIIRGKGIINNVFELQIAMNSVCINEIKELVSDFPISILLIGSADIVQKLYEFLMEVLQ